MGISRFGPAPRVMIIGAAAAAGLLLLSVAATPAGAVSGHHKHVHRKQGHHKHTLRGTDPDPANSVSSAPPPVTGGTKSAGSAELASVFGPNFAGAKFCAFAQQNSAVSSGVLTVSYPAGSSAPSAGAPYGGAQLCEPFASGPKTEATLTYRLRIPVGFQFVKGGKLPGLYGGVEPFSGGGHNPGGWSMRLMWRSGGAGEVYGYIATTTGYGNDWGRGNFGWLADGNWHTVSEQVHLNTAGHADGWVALYYDGKRVVNQTGLRITTSGTPISGLFFSTFFGGHDSSWAPTVNQHLDFAGFEAS